jgi:hypothetical protein
MNRRTFKTILLIIACTSVSLAQERPSWREVREDQRQRRAPKDERTPPVPRAEPAPSSDAQLEGSKIERGQVTLKLARGGRVSINNSSGPITIQGSDRDTVEANAVGDSEPVGIRVYQSPSRPVIVLSVASIEGRRFAGEAHLKVKLPRYADIEMVDSRNHDIEVSDVDGSVIVGGSGSSVTVNRVGSLQVTTQHGETTARDIKGSFIAHTAHGEVTVETVGGRVEVATANGEVRVRNAGADVRVNSTSGEIDIRCAKGRVEATSASGSITLVGVNGDVEANTGSGEVTFIGPIRADGRYRLKSLSGEVGMAIQENPPGFAAILVTYNGEVETVFPLKLTSPLRGTSINRRIAGVYGDGGAQIGLDSFNGAVRILKMVPNSLKECK